MKVKLFASTVLAAAASLLMAATPASAQSYGNYGYGSRSNADIVLFEHGDFRGRTLGVDNAIPDLDRAGFNDKTSSIQVLRGRWEVCTDGNFRGNCQIVDADIPNMNYLRMNDSISSVRRVNGYAWGNGRNDRYGDYDRRDRYRDRNDRRDDRWGRNNGSGYGGLVVYEHANFGGWGVPLSGDVYDLNQIRINDEISSIEVNSGRWLVCSDPGFRGRCAEVYGTMNSAHSIRMNDQISSIRRIG